MAEYIERENVLKIFMDMANASAKLYPGLMTAYSQIKTAPTADVRPERHGEWITRHDGLPFCSECNYNGLGYIAVDLGYCPNCGAKMDGKDGDSG